MKGSYLFAGNSINDQKEQLNFLYRKMELLLTMLNSIEPEEAGLEEIDRIIEMLDDIENKCKKFRNELKVGE
ncbi:hypothetical protein KHA80_07945 [Anaerobacillus sp. HL2]|nr:hypothetical protein KHA80_07945 [Anaerobacillus sp. HL2]